MALNLTTFDPALKHHYGPQTLMEVSLTNRPLLGMMPKYTNFGGKSMPVPLKYGANPNVSADFGGAQRTSTATSSFGTSSSSQVEFNVKRIKKYGVAEIDGETIKAAEGDVNAFVTAVTHEFDATLERLADRIHWDLYRDGLGLIDGVTAQATTTLLDLDNPESSVAIEVGDLVVLAESASETAALVNSGEVRQVTAIDRSAGTVTINAAFTAFASGNTGFLYFAGDRQAAAITTVAQRLCMTGVASWVASTAPSASEDFWGIDRSVDGTKLAGVRVDGSSLTYREALKKLCFEIGRIGSAKGKQFSLFMNLTDANNLINEMEGQIRYTRVPGSGPDGQVDAVGFDGIEIVTPVGKALVFPDHACPKGRAYALDLSTWMLASAGMFPALLEEDGLTLQRKANSDAYEGRFGGYAQCICMAPGRNGTVTLPSS